MRQSNISQKQFFKGERVVVSARIEQKDKPETPVRPWIGTVKGHCYNAFDAVKSEISYNS